MQTKPFFFSSIYSFIKFEVLVSLPKSLQGSFHENALHLVLLRPAGSSDWSVNCFVVVVYNNFILKVQSEFSVKSMTKNILMDTIIKLFTNQSELRALPAGWFTVLWIALMSVRNRLKPIRNIPQNNAPKPSTDRLKSNCPLYFFVSFVVPIPGFRK